LGDSPGLGDWIGLDFNEKAKDEGLAAGLTNFIVADFDAPLPLADGIADVVVFSHVVEHLPRPDFTISEIARVLRPGGLLVAGSPVLPWPLSLICDRMRKNRLSSGAIRRGDHIQILSRPRRKKLLKSVSLELEFMSGAFLFRYSGNPLEDYHFWFRLNTIWGVLFPPLGNEIYLTARKS
jgi:SAM-dependent methyltransferase